MAGIRDTVRLDHLCRKPSQEVAFLSLVRHLPSMALMLTKTLKKRLILLVCVRQHFLYAHGVIVTKNLPGFWLIVTVSRCE